MVVYLGADHGGFALKERLKSFVKGLGYEVFDVGAETQNPDDDYPDFGGAVGKEVSADPVGRRGILICRSGIGMAVVANKFQGVRAGFSFSPDHAFSARHDDDMNVLCLAADFATPEEAEQIVRVFLITPFGADERYVRRLKKIEEIEGKWCA